MWLTCPVQQTATPRFYTYPVCMCLSSYVCLSVGLFVCMSYQQQEWNGESVGSCRYFCLRASAGRDFFFLMTLRVPLIHYVDISRRHSHKCVCTIMVINVQNQQFSASPNSSNVTNLAKRSEFCWKHGTFRPQVVILGNVPGHLGIYRRAATAVCFPNM